MPRVQSKTEKAIRFMISGTIGTQLFYLMYQALHYLPFETYKTSFAWFVAYLASILWQAELHARLVFQRPITNYKKTMIQMYGAYGISIGLSTLLSFVLTEWFSMTPQNTYWITIISTGIVNYFTVSSIFEQ